MQSWAYTQRLGLAAALLHELRVLFLDESRLQAWTHWPASDSADAEPGQVIIAIVFAGGAIVQKKQRLRADHQHVVRP